MVGYGFFHEPQLLGGMAIFSYIFSVLLGISLFYLTFLFTSTFLFWFPELQVTEAVWESIQEYGRYPTNLYHGSVGLLLNLVIPLTLMASIPVEFLLGRMLDYMIILYVIIIVLLFLFTRWFWMSAIKKYSSFST